MKSNNLALVFETTKRLEKINHPDPVRISKEICEFVKYNKSEVDNVILRLSANEPWEYIKGFSEFDGNKIYVDRSTLIPRLETLQILEIFKEFNEVECVADIGCGSGAIGISIAKKYPTLHVTLVDISNEALDIAKRNIKESMVEKNTKVLNNNLINSLEFKPKTIVIANLPYIPTNEYQNLDKSVKDYEPRTALDGGIDGLDLISELLVQIFINENITGAIFEIDPSQESKIKNILSLQSRFKYSFIRDFRGLLRFFKLYL